MTSWASGSWRNTALSPNSATCFRSGLSPRTGRATCACWRLRAWSGTWTAAHTRKCSRCARPVHAPFSILRAVTARGATSTSTPLAAMARRCRASFLTPAPLGPASRRPQRHVPGFPSAPVMVAAD